MADAATSEMATLRRLNDDGYGFYQNVARVRDDDLLVRGRAAAALHRCCVAVNAAEHAACADLPAPSREDPFPDAVKLATVRRWRALRERIATLETRLRGAAALPDRDFSRAVPSEAARQQLVGLDALLIARAEAAAAAAGGDAAALAGALAALEVLLAAREEFAGRSK